MNRTSAKSALLSLFFMLLSFSGTNPVYAAPPAQASITVDAEKSLGAISPLLYGVFFEEINQNIITFFINHIFPGHLWRQPLDNIGRVKK